ncbi:MAG: TonB-dependent receptor [Chitinophagaceae bacterium]|nr:TonB-dependent receptor [Chitinophagaceae bacterium]
MSKKSPNCLLAALAVFSVLLSFTSYSQIKVTGVISNDKKEFLSGATINEKGTSNSTSTKPDGAFNITVRNSESVLVISAIGHLPMEVTVGQKTEIEATLASTNREMDSVVVVGYGTQKKISNTGAQSSMSGTLLVQSPVANISNSLVGRLPGLFASQGSGEPGNDQSTLRIRGVGTFNGSQEPLVLVDGIQVDNYNNIDPNEIENVTILKDASSTAVYGIRGANGVLIITTKRGKAGPAKVAYTFNNAINSFTAIRAQMNAYDWANSFNQAIKADAYLTGGAYTPRYSDADLQKYKDGSDPIFFPNVDWYKLMLRKNSIQQQHNLSINGGTDKVKYAVSIGMFNQQGLFNNTDLNPDYDAQVRFRRYNFRSNLNFTVTKRFRIQVDMSSQTEQRSGSNGATASIIESIARANPTVAPGVVDGKIIVFPSGGNPLVGLYEPGYQREYRNFLNGSLRLDHDLDFITKGLTTHIIASYQNFNSQRFVNRKNGVPAVIPYVPVRQPDGSIAFLPQVTDASYGSVETIRKNRRITAEFAIDYKRSFGKHNVSGLLLYNQQKNVDPTYAFLVPSGYQSYVGRATYDYKSRYLAQVDIAYNGTENFAPGKRFGTFPAYSLGWVVSQEDFFPKSEIINFLKFRGSYGEVGSDQIGANFLTSNNRFLYRPTAWTFIGGTRFGETPGSLNTVLGALEGRGSNPDLTWERAKKANLGIEMSFWKRKVNLTVELFDEKRDNILATRQTISSIIGVPIPSENLGKMQNRGYEIDLTLNNNLGQFNYQINANYSFARNKILYQDEVNQLYAYQARTGQRFGQIFGLIDQGLFNTWEEVNDPKRPTYLWNNNKIQPGDIRYVDYNNDGKVDNFDQVPIGFSQVPEITYGFSLIASYKGFSISALFQGVSNVSLPYTRRFNSAFFDAIPSGAVDYLIESWTEERYNAGLPIRFPRFSAGSNSTAVNNYQSSTFFLADASYLRLKNVEVGYTISSRILNKVGISSARIYANANNLYTWSKVYPGVDPESPPTPTNQEPYPLVKTINTGVKLNF